MSALDSVFLSMISASLIKVHVCPICKSENFVRTDDGALTCEECGTQLAGVREEVNESGGAAAVLALGSSNVRRKVLRNLETTGAADSAAPLVTVNDGFEAFQFLLQTLLRALVSTCGLDARLPAATGALWLATAQTFSEVVDEDADAAFAPLLAPPVMRSRYGRLRVYSRHRNSHSLPLTSPLSLILCYLGCLELRLPIHAQDLVTWCASGELPFLSAYRSLPARLQPVARVKAGVAIVRPMLVPCADDLVSGAAILCERLTRPPPAPPDADALVRRLAAQLTLPATASALAIGAVREASRAAERRATQVMKKRKRVEASAEAPVESNAPVAVMVDDAEAEDEPAPYTADSRQYTADSRQSVTWLTRDPFKHRAAWLRAAAAVAMAAKLTCELRGPLSAAPPSAATSEPSEPLAALRAAARIGSADQDEDAEANWCRLEAAMSEFVRRHALGEVVPPPHSRVAGVPHMAHPADVRQAVQVASSHLPAYLDFVRANILTERPKRKEMQVEEDGLLALATALEAEQPAAQQQPAERELPVQQPAPRLAAIDGGPGAEHGYLIGAEGCSGRWHRPSNLSNTLMPPRYALLLRGLACLVHGDWQNVRRAMASLERTVLGRFQKFEPRPAVGAHLACLHCGDRVGKEGLRCVRCYKSYSACQCPTTLPLCTRCDEAGVARSTSRNVARVNYPCNYMALVRPTACRCLACNQLFFPLASGVELLKLHDKGDASRFQHVGCPACQPLSSTGKPDRHRAGQLPRLNGRPLAVHETIALEGTLELETARRQFLRQSSRMPVGQDAHAISMVGVRRPIDRCPRSWLLCVRGLLGRARGLKRNVISELGDGWACAYLPPYRANDARATGNDASDEDDVPLTQRAGARRGATSGGVASISCAELRAWIPPDGTRCFTTLRTAIIYARNCRPPLHVDATPLHVDATPLHVDATEPTADQGAFLVVAMVSPEEDEDSSREAQVTCRTANRAIEPNTQLGRAVEASLASAIPSIDAVGRWPHHYACLKCARQFGSLFFTSCRTHMESCCPQLIKETDNLRQRCMHGGLPFATVADDSSSEDDTMPLNLRYEALRRARKNGQRRAKLEEARRLRHEKRRKRINRKNEQRKREKRLGQLQAFGWKEGERPSSSSSNGPVRLHWRNQLFVHPVHGEATSIKRILRAHRLCEARDDASEWRRQYETLQHR